MNFLLTLPVLLAQGYVDPAYVIARTYCASKMAGRTEQETIDDTGRAMALSGIPRSEFKIQAKRVGWYLQSMCGGW